MFVVFEGIDGSGKTTLSNRVATRLREQGLGVTHVREQGRFASAVTQSIRELGRDQRNLAMTPRAEMMLMVARDLQLLEEATMPALRTSDVVLADRFLYTAEVLAEYGRGLPAAEVDGVIAAVSGGIQPDLVVLVDVDPHLARARRAVSKLLGSTEARPASRKGLAGRGLQQRMRDGYLELAAKDPDRWIVIDNSDASLAVVEAAIVAGLLAAQQGGVALGREVLREKLGPGALGSGPIATATSLAEAQQRFLAWVDRRAVSEPDVAAYQLAGMWGHGIDTRRLALAERSPAVVAYGLRRLDDAVSWRLRHQLLESAPRQVAESLVGAAGEGEAAARLRRELLPLVPAEVASSLLLRDDDDAWAMREELFPSVPHAVIASLGTLGTPRAWALRERFLGERGGDKTLASYDDADTVCRSISGLDDQRAWELRERAYQVSPVSALESLEGAHSPRAHDWRRRHLERAPRPVMKSLFGITDEQAWQLRADVAERCKEAVGSVYGLDAPEAWKLREQCRDLWPSSVAGSLGPELARTPRGVRLVEYLLATHGGIALWRAAAAVASEGDA